VHHHAEVRVILSGSSPASIACAAARSLPTITRSIPGSIQKRGGKSAKSVRRTKERRPRQALPHGVTDDAVEIRYQGDHELGGPLAQMGGQQVAQRGPPQSDQPLERSEQGTKSDDP
jgi:hypothetical protein